MLEKHRRVKCTSTPSTCTGTPVQKSGSRQSVPVHLQRVPIHLCRKVVVTKVYRYTTNVYRYTCLRTTGIELEFDPNARAHLPINLECEITLERGIKATVYNEKELFR